MFFEIFGGLRSILTYIRNNYGARRSIFQLSKNIFDLCNLVWTEPTAARRFRKRVTDLKVKFLRKSFKRSQVGTRKSDSFDGRSVPLEQRVASSETKRKVGRPTGPTPPRTLRQQPGGLTSVPLRAGLLAGVSPAR